MSSEPGPSAFVDLPLEAFPFTIELVGKQSGEVLFSDEVKEPGALRVPGRETLGEPVFVRVSYPGGQIDMSE